MATFRTYAEALRPDHPMAKIHKAALTWHPSRYRPAEMDRDMRAEPGAVLADVFQRTGGAYETTVRLTPKDRKSTRLNSSHVAISYAVFCLKKKTTILNIFIPRHHYTERHSYLLLQNQI